MTNSCNVLAYRVKKIQHHYGQPPEAIPSLPAFVAAYHVLTGTLGIDTVTKAAIATGVPRPAIDNALVVLQADNPAWSAWSWPAAKACTTPLRAFGRRSS